MMHEVYLADDAAGLRFALGRYEERPLIFLGINPSTADLQTSDPTVTRMAHIAAQFGYDGFLALNVCPRRAAKLTADFPKTADPAAAARQLDAFRTLVPEGAVVVAVWGAMIGFRPSFADALRDIAAVLNAKHVDWRCLCLTKAGHPHHPLYLSYDKIGLVPFDIRTYLQRYHT